METDNVTVNHWRKSSQWFALNRAHAQLALADNHVREIFHRYCYTNLTRMFPICVSDEHYFPSLLASYSLDAQTDCQGVAHYADWSLRGWHPRAFLAQDITDTLVDMMRGVNGVPGIQGSACDVDAAVQSANRLFIKRSGSMSQDYRGVNVPGATAISSNIFNDRNSYTSGSSGGTRTGDNGGLPSASNGASMHAGSRPSPAALRYRRTIPGKQQQDRDHQQSKDSLMSHLHDDHQASLSNIDWVLAQGYRPMGYECSLFARKFGPAIVNETLAMALSCTGLGFGSWC